LAKNKKKKPTVTAAPKAPQDHKPKAIVEPTEVEFTIGEDTYKLPRLNSEIIGKIEGRIVEGALLDGEEGQIRMAFALLRAVAGYEKTKEALRSQPFPEMAQILLGWVEKSGSKLGESAG